MLPPPPSWERREKQLKKRRYKELGEEVRQHILSISPAQIDRLLKKYKVNSGKGAWRRGRSPDAIKKGIEVPAETWNVDEAGWLEIDTVAHCGGEMRGSFLWTLTMVDILSGWTQLAIVWNKTASRVVERIREAFDTSFQHQRLRLRQGKRISQR